MKAFRKGNSQREFHQSFRSQSAMEYLMTYGWAILIIAVVLAALFELGVFNPMTFAPKAAPGSCQVVRPEGAGTTNFISLEGECNGELPQYVAIFSPNSIEAQSGYGASNTYIKIDTPFGGGESNYTMTAWVSIPFYNPCSGACGIPIAYYNPGGGLGLETGGGIGLHRGNGSDTFVPFPAFVPNTWYFIAVSIKYPNYHMYQDSVEENTSNTGNYMDTNPIYLGAEFFTNGATFSGDISNVQLYNTPLSSNDIRTLYKEGIGGATINLQSLVGWWPLNGNANDYSGNGNNGVPNGVTYTSNWYSGYSAP